MLKTYMYVDNSDWNYTLLNNFKDYMIKPTRNNIELYIYFSLRYWYILAIAYRKTQPMYNKFMLELSLKSSDVFLFSLFQRKITNINIELYNDVNIFSERNCFQWGAIFLLMLSFTEYTMPTILLQIFL